MLLLERDMLLDLDDELWRQRALAAVLLQLEHQLLCCLDLGVCRHGPSLDRK